MSFKFYLDGKLNKISLFFYQNFSTQFGLVSGIHGELSIFPLEILSSQVVRNLISECRSGFI